MESESDWDVTIKDILFLNKNTNVFEGNITKDAIYEALGMLSERTPKIESIALRKLRYSKHIKSLKQL